MIGIDEIILCDNKAKNVGIAIVTARLFNEVSVQKNESKQLGYSFTIPGPGDSSPIDRIGFSR